MPYVGAFVAAVPVKNKEAHVALAESVCAVLRSNRATSVAEDWGDDMPGGEGE